MLKNDADWAPEVAEQLLHDHGAAVLAGLATTSPAHSLEANRLHRALMWQWEQAAAKLERKHEARTA